MIAHEKSEILAWLSPLEPQRRYQDIRTCRVNEVGGWLLQTHEYRNRVDDIRGGESDGLALFCLGILLGSGLGRSITIAWTS